MKAILVLVLMLTLVLSMVPATVFAGIMCDAYKHTPAPSYFFLCLWELVNDYFDPIDWMDDK